MLITSNQLKYTNLIFVEHQKLLEENSLLKKQINNYQNKIVLLNQTDSIRLEQINNYKKINQIYENNLNQLLKKDKNTKTILSILGVGVSIGFIYLIFK